MLVHETSLGRDPARLRAGRDLVFDIPPEHGLSLPDGVLAGDHLDQLTRWEIHRGGVDAIARCRAALDAPLTVDGLCLPWLWELPIERAMVTMLTHAEGLRRAVERHEPDALELAGAGERTRRIVTAVAAWAQIGVTVRPPLAAARRPRSLPSPTLARRRAVAIAREIGVPSRLRPGSVLFVSYWPLMALLDRMLDDPLQRPAVMTRNLPTGPSRSLRAARRGGWVGTAGPAGRRRAGRMASAAIAAAARAAPPQLEVFGLQLGAAAHGAVLEIARARAATDVATAATLRRAFRRAAPAAVLSAWDVEPGARLITTLAREAGVRTLGLAHGAFLLPQTLPDLDLCDEALIWSQAVGPPISNHDRPIHAVGYPEPRPAAPATRAAPTGRSPRVLVLAQPALPDVGLTSPRIAMRQYEVAVGALLEHCPEVQIVLRPHPSGGRHAEDALAALHPRASFEIDSASSILDVLAGCDLCIGTITTATLQAALVGTPVIALNLMGFDWRPPLGGGETAVPVVHDAAELQTWLQRWSAREPLPGREDLLAALGARPEGDDPTERMLAIVSGARAR